MWGREMRAGLVFVLVSLAAGGAFREWRRSHEHRFRDFVALLEEPGEGEEEGLGGTPPAASARPDSLAAFPARQGRALPGPGRLNLDRADAAEWERLPGIGPALARRIVADRDARGPFREPGALLRVPGIGPKTLERIRPFLGPAPVATDSQAAN